jgi:DNA modification methylase
MLNSCYFGDVRDGLRAFADAGIRPQTVVTSPPYFGLRDYGHPGQLGLERTPDEYVANMVEVFRLVREVLADDGTLWLNIGDSYANDAKWGGSTGGKHAAGLHGDTGIGRRRVTTGLKPKDLIGIPWMLAFALRADGWYLRQEIIWHKPNPMPESVTDRCTKAHESLFLLAKSERYYYDAEAVKETANPDSESRYKSTFNKYTGSETQTGERGHKGVGTPEKSVDWTGTRNRRSVWTIATTPYAGAHFATFPPALVEPCILAGSRPGDIVLDPFMGSGTTARVAVSLGRQWVGCEINPEYKDLQDGRTAQVQIRLDGAYTP